MQGAWTPDSHSKAGLNPVHRGLFDPDGYLEDGQVSRHMARRSGLGFPPGFAVYRYIQPVGRIYHEVEVPGCGGGRRIRIPSAAGSAFTPGQFVSIGETRTGAVILGHPPSGQIGASAFALDVFDDGAYDELRIVAADPETFPPNMTDVVYTLTGYGFRETPLDTIMAAVYLGDEDDPDFGEYEADPFVTVHDVTFVSEYSVTVLIDSLSTTPNDYRVGFAWRRGS